MKDSELLEIVETLQNGLVSVATGGGFGDADYEALRRTVTTDPRTRDLAPRFLRTNRTVQQFWQWIKRERPGYAERRNFLWGEFNPILEALEGGAGHPADDPISEVLKDFGREAVYAAWTKALDRRRDDPEGAITAARTLLETVCKHILDEAPVGYSDAADLPHLYQLTARHLNIAPSQHLEQIFKQILGGCTAVIEGLGALRNKLSDAHGVGSKPVKPATRHAELAVNLAGTMATFLVSTWEFRKGKTQ
jgi:hypothetical protein